MGLLHLSLSGLSVLVALILAAWEVYFFWYSGDMSLGLSLAWIVTAYLSYQLLSIPFAMANSATRFIGVIDAMASLVPLAVMLIVLFGRSDLLRTGDRWQIAIILLVVSGVDLFGGFAFNIALSRRTVDVLGR